MPLHSAFIKVLKKSFISLLAVGLIMACAGCESRRGSKGSSQAPSHRLFDHILDDYVKGDRFDYEALKNDDDDVDDLNEYLQMMGEHPPLDDWLHEEKLAFWINAYNAFTIKLILDNYPLKSIKELNPPVYIPRVNSIWKKKFFKIGWVAMSLDEIEHELLRREFDEPRIHFAINCASVSCPPLRDEAYVAKKIDRQLEEQSRRFINNRRWNTIKTDHIRISKLFNWYGRDFRKKGSLIGFLNNYSETPISPDAEIDYMDYDWSLNDVR